MEHKEGPGCSTNTHGHGSHSPGAVGAALKPLPPELAEHGEQDISRSTERSTSPHRCTCSIRAPTHQSQRHGGLHTWQSYLQACCKHTQKFTNYTEITTTQPASLLMSLKSLLRKPPVDLFNHRSDS